MTTQEFEAQRDGAATYRMVYADEARARGYPDAPERGWWRDPCCLYRFDAEGRAVELIGTDGGEPEDQVLTRDWAWVAEALNREAERCHAAARGAREQALREAEVVCRERVATHRKDEDEACRDRSWVEAIRWNAAAVAVKETGDALAALAGRES
ncbi:MAG TPA: hypothetical protein VEA99_10370 [Gemmatimonadaceae bacterium]|nr:hypothetical protein [Gemmatimonadaceae bacterium]